MKKSYSCNGVIYEFTNVRMECGVLYGMCTNPFFYGMMAWLDKDGFQFESSHKHIDALEVVECQSYVDNSYTMWGCELRDKLPHGARYYSMGRR